MNEFSTFQLGIYLRTNQLRYLSVPSKVQWSPLEVLVRERDKHDAREQEKGSQLREKKIRDEMCQLEEEVR